MSHCEYKSSKFDQNYVPLNNYQVSMGVPIFSAIPVTQHTQIVPSFKGYDYNVPNYNSLTLGSCQTPYPSVLQGYQRFCPDGNCVDYLTQQVPCDTMTPEQKKQQERKPIPSQAASRPMM